MACVKYIYIITKMSETLLLSFSHSGQLSETKFITAESMYLEANYDLEA